MKHLKSFNEEILNLSDGDKLFICAWEGDGGDRESCSIFYSKVVKAKSRKEALEKYFNSGEKFGESGDISKYVAVEIRNIIE